MSARLTHADLCERAVSWLLGNRRCNVAFSGIASTREIPDAIGWSTSSRTFGSHVVECKASVSDFKRDERKHFEWKRRGDGYLLRSGRLTDMRAAELGYKRWQRSLMGTRRWFMSPVGVVTAEMVKDRYPGHGLLWVRDRLVDRIIEAEERPASLVDTDSEIRLLQFALVHVRDNMSARGEFDLNEMALHPMTLRKRERRQMTP